MSVVGFDVGNENCVVAIARQRGIDVVLNDESKRETPAMVTFGEKQRFLGTSASAVSTMNPKNTITEMKRLIGKKFSDPEVQKDLGRLPFTVIAGPDDEPLIQAQYLGETRTFTARQVLAALMSNLKTIAEQNLGTSVVDCVIGIPSYFTQGQRLAYLDAARICGLNPLRLMHETTATALAYGIYKTDLPETDPLHVAFVDVGHSSLQVCITAFKKGQLKMLAHTFDRNLGGRDFDEVLFNHFADQFKTEYKMDVRSNTKACMRLRAACEKLKKVLSANPEAPLNVECLMDEKDVRAHIKRDLFEELSASILDRVLAPCKRAMEEAGLTPDKIGAVEIVGSGSRVPAILKILTTFFGREPSRTMNASECIARGCALQCAMLSPTFRVRDFDVQDSFIFPIALVAKGQAAEVEGEETASAVNTVVFQKNNPLPSTKIVTYLRSETFAVDAVYADPSMLPPSVPPKMATFTIGPFTNPKPDERSKLKVKFRLNLHGVVSVESATQSIEEEVEVPVTTEAPKGVAPMETEQKPGEGNGASDAKMEDAEGTGQVPGSAEETGPTGDDKLDKMETDSAKPEVIKKKKLKKVEVPLGASIYGALSEKEVESLKEAEFEMELQDRVMEETKERKNAVEAYVYDMRNKLCDKLQEYVTLAEKEDFSARLNQMEDWLYEDGEDEVKGVYIAKLEELKKLGDPIELRQREDEVRSPAVETLLYCITSFRDAALSSDPKYEHIDSADKEKVVEECGKAESWLKDKQQQQSLLPKSANPVLLSAEVRKKTETLDRFCKPIMTRPKPAPPKPAAASADTKDDSKKSDSGAGHEETASAEQGDKMETDVPKEGEYMQQD
eukprot:TRINITY_DN812_c0_g1_i1.p1 TRINITY_DN812_c0_g1~~TRINITY_DN812_c0_g1_i1.p1  ORF type:complete len:845 (+),score=229.45 TRINITY_DN812_c0_g1_i1:156-2690(+)